MGGVVLVLVSIFMWRMRKGSPVVYRNSLPYRDLPTTETWAISEPLMYHGTVLMYYVTMSKDQLDLEGPNIVSVW